MYKLNIEKGIKCKYQAVIKKLYFKKLWLTIDRKEFNTKKECKNFYKTVAAF